MPESAESLTELRVAIAACMIAIYPDRRTRTTPPKVAVAYGEVNDERTTT